MSKGEPWALTRISVRCCRAFLLSIMEMGVLGKVSVGVVLSAW